MKIFAGIRRRLRNDFGSVENIVPDVGNVFTGLVRLRIGMFQFVDGSLIVFPNAEIFSAADFARISISGAGLILFERLDVGCKFPRRLTFNGASYVGLRLNKFILRADGQGKHSFKR